jgi:hemolysin III
MSHPPIRPLREEAASAAIQGSAAAASVVGTAYLVTRVAAHATVSSVAAVFIYGLSMTAAFLVSALYHGVQHGRLKAVLREIDHCTIFLFIAGTYTAVAALALSRSGGLLLAMIWVLAALGIALRLKNGPRFLPAAMSIYLVMGWLFVGWSAALYRAVGPIPIALIVAGGVSYTGGLLFHRWHRLPYANPLWHCCVVVGSACLYYAITRFPQI